MKMKNLIYWVERNGRWISVFITTPDLPKTELGDIIGEIYNLRRRTSHKKIKLCWKNLQEKSVNEFKQIQMWPVKLKTFSGPFIVDWEY